MSEDTPAFTEQAKWLIERHLRRSEGLATRAAAILGFTGLTLALLLQGIKSLAPDANAWIWISLILTTSSLLLAAVCCIVALSTTDTVLPRSAQLRKWWANHAKDPQANTYARNIAETFLNSTDLSHDSPIESAMNLANRRARWFGRGVWCLLVALCFLATLMFEVLLQARGR